MNTELACSLIIFGGTGDLTHRKLLPAIYNLAVEEKLPETFSIVAVGRQEKTEDTYRDEIYQSISKHSRFSLNEAVWQSLRKRIHYKVMDFSKPEMYADLEQYLQAMSAVHQTEGNRIYYLAVGPEHFEPIVDNLDQYCLNQTKQGWQRVVIEKPFGRDLKTAFKLNHKIVEVFTEENTYRIDHYLGKEMLQNIMVIRFANTLFEPLWNNQHIKQVQISSSETLGVENRGGYYEHAGAIRDMVQSHLLQLLSLITMEKPNNLTATEIRDKKVQVLQDLTQLTKEDMKHHVVRGQYGASSDGKVLAYRDEVRVDKNSETETYVALKLTVNNPRWEGVPFYIRTGKQMPHKSTEIVIQFKDVINNLYPEQTHILPNTLVIKIQPQEGILFQFNNKLPGNELKIVPVQMDFCQNCLVGINSPEAYERLLLDVMNGDATLFARWDEVYHSWKFIDTIFEAWQEEIPDFPNYQPNTYGPKAADLLLARDNLSWINVNKE